VAEVVTGCIWLLTARSVVALYGHDNRNLGFIQEQNLTVRETISFSRKFILIWDGI
jgi:hypothetical protein